MSVYRSASGAEFEIEMDGLEGRSHSSVLVEFDDGALPIGSSSLRTAEANVDNLMIDLDDEFEMADGRLRVGSAPAYDPFSLAYLGDRHAAV